jgi:type I restriction enzyme S subunit
MNNDNSNDWQECKLGDVVASANTGLDAIRRAPIVEKETGLKCLRIQDISQSKPFINWGNTEVTSENLSKFQLMQNDIIMARTCSTGICTFIRNDIRAVFNNGLVRIRANENFVLPVFLYYLFLSRDFLGHVDGISGGTSVQLNMQIGNLLSYEFTLPPLPEQRAIAAVLSSLDDKIDLLNRQNKTLEALAATLWRKMFVEDADPGWGKGKLGDLLELCYGKALKEENRVPGEYPVLGSNGIVGYHNEFLVKGPGIVIGRKGTLGVVNYIEQNFFPIDTTFYIKSKTNSGKLFYEYFLLKTFALEDLNSDSAVPGLNRENAHAMEVNLPSLDVVIKYNTIAESLFSKKLTNSLQIRTLSTLHDGLLPKLMSGEVRVKQ